MDVTKFFGVEQEVIFIQGLGTWSKPQRTTRLELLRLFKKGFEKRWNGYSSVTRVMAARTREKLGLIINEEIAGELARQASAS
jgi:hypothetical protein